MAYIIPQSYVSSRPSDRRGAGRARRHDILASGTLRRRLVSDELVFEVPEDAEPGRALGAVEARGAALRWALAGGDGRFALNPAAGLLAVAAPLDYESRSQYNLTVTVLAMVRARGTRRAPARGPRPRSDPRLSRRAAARPRRGSRCTCWTATSSRPCWCGASTAAACRRRRRPARWC